MNPASRVACRWLAAIIAAAIALRCGAALWWQARLTGGKQFYFADSESYWVLARELAAGRPYQFGSPDARAFRMPGYPLLLAGLFKLYSGEPPVLAARMVGALLGGIAVLFVYLLARQAMDAPSALFAAGAAAVYPGSIVTSVAVLSEALFCPLAVAQLAVWAQSWQAGRGAQSWLLALAAGLLAGAAALVRPEWLMFPAFALPALAWHWRSHRLGKCATLIAGIILAMAPWWVRNYLAVGKFVPTTLQLGASLYDGLNPRATGASDMRFVAEWEACERRRDRLSQEPFEVRLDRSLRNAALSWAWQHPQRVAELAAAKCWRMWRPLPDVPTAGARWARWGFAGGYLLLLLLAVLGSWCGRRQAWLVRACWLPAAYLTLLHLVFVSSVRYREPAMLVLAVLAGFVWQWRRGGATACAG
jgi:4-amino-4-deoxy-L-arabinose transferase-like glycosyltransferase